MSVMANVIALVLGELEQDPALCARARRVLGLVDRPPSVPSEREYDTLDEFAERLGVSKRHAADLRAQGRLVVVGSGRSVRIDVAASLDRLRRQALPGPDVIDIDARRRARAAASKITRR